MTRPRNTKYLSIKSEQRQKKSATQYNVTAVYHYYLKTGIDQMKKTSKTKRLNKQVKSGKISKTKAKKANKAYTRM